jgi:hypothetical protein
MKRWKKQLRRMEVREKKAGGKNTHASCWGRSVNIEKYSALVLALLNTSLFDAINTKGQTRSSKVTPTDSAPDLIHNG